MRRVFATLATTALLLAGGCAGKYEARLNQTLEDMRYRKRLNDNLMDPVTKTKLETYNVYLRPPKSLAQSKEFLLTVLDPGKFDDAESFTDKQNLMHVLTRVKLPKAPAKKGAAEPPPPVNRGDFTTDVVGLLNGVYNVEVDSAKAKEESKKNNKFKHIVFEANGKVVHLYIHGAKTSTEVALIFEFPKSEQAALVSKIDLCLESFATGEKARRAFSGSETEEEATEGAGGAPAVF